MDLPDKLVKLRDVLYSIIATPEDQRPEALVNQELKVGLTNAMQGKGNIIIIQNQSVRMQEVTNYAIIALKELDDLLAESKRPALASDPVRDCCRRFAEEGLGLKEMAEVMRRRYIEYLHTPGMPRTELAGILQCSAAGAQLLIKKYGIEERIDE